MDNSDHDAPATKTGYRAPALEKGLDILELLSAEGGRLSFPTIAQRLGRSSGELFRMVQVLETRGYVEQDIDGFTLTPRLFEIGLGRPPIRNLVEIALPIMRRLATRTKQSCHLVLPSRGEMVVVARMESPEQLGFSVRIGYRQPLYVTGSGSILYAFQPADVQAAWERQFVPAPSKAELAAFRAHATGLRLAGIACQPSRISEGITDIAAPVMRGDRATAALAVPLLRPKREWMPVDAIAEMLRQAAIDISNEIVVSDNRV